MGYSTSFSGKLLFTSEVTGPQLARLSKILGEDRRDHPSWPHLDDDNHWAHVDLMVSEDYGGLEWDGSEKTYGMISIVNTVLAVMQKEFPDFGLVGRMDAQGEEIGDVWAVDVPNGGIARKIEYKLEGRQIDCPRCGESFVLDGELVELEDV